ncbi:MAG: hypothetical protein U1E02_38845, partial [Hydrogenophaga sp.]|nr:hypothetical protein [Hydrogenophaga sp.]
MAPSARPDWDPGHALRGCHLQRADSGPERQCAVPGPGLFHISHPGLSNSTSPSASITRPLSSF